MEFGLFLALAVLGSIGLARQSFGLLGLSIAAFFILAVYIAAEDVTLQQHSDAFADKKDGNGTLVATSTATKDDNINIFKDNRVVMSYVFYALGCIAAIVFFRRVFGVVVTKV
jgi:hypothetical protein